MSMRGVLLCGVISAAATHPAFAQVSPAAGAEPAVAPASELAVEPARQAAAEAVTDQASSSPESSAQLIDILNYRIEGNTVLPRIEVEKAVMPYLGPKRTPKDVESAREALEKAYRAAGYETVAVQIPEQDVRGGIVRLEVQELKVGRLRVTDARYFSPEDIKRRAPSLAEGQVPNYADVAREMGELNKSAGRTITPALRAGDTPGTVDVDLQVEDRRPLHATFEVNDRTSANTERLRASASVRFSNLFQREHSFSLQGQVAPEDIDQSSVVSASYVAPIQGTPWSIIGYGVRSDSNVAAVGGIDVVGNGDIFGLRGIYSFSKHDVLHTLTAGIDYKSFSEDLILGSDTAATPIDYVPLSLQYALATRGEKWDFDASTTLTFGLRGLDADQKEFQTKRYNSSASWAHLRMDLALLRRFQNDFRIGGRVSGQASGEPLISNEQFSAGGLESVRGYYESQELGDGGVSLQIDAESPSLFKNSTWINELRFLAFADGAYVSIRDPLPDPTTKIKKRDATLLSAGLGMRLRLFGKLNTSLLVAAPLEDPESTLTDWGGDYRGMFRIWLEL